MKKLLPEQFMITDSQRVDLLLAANKLSAGSGIILRDYDLSYSKRFELGLALKKICRERKLVFLVAKDFKLAQALNADGMHFPEFMLAEARRVNAKMPNWIITVAAHSKTKVIAAYKNNVDSVFISPVYKTDSHSDKKPLGLHKARLLIYRDYPAHALGGVSLKHKKSLKYNGFYGFAGIGWPLCCVEIATVSI